MTLFEYMSVEDPHKLSSQPVVKKDGRYWQKKRRENEAREEERRAKARAKKKASNPFQYNELWGMRKKKRVTADSVNAFIAKQRGESEPVTYEKQDPREMLLDFDAAPVPYEERKYYFWQHVLCEWPDGAEHFPELNIDESGHMEKRPDRVSQGIYVLSLKALAKAASSKEDWQIAHWAKLELEFWEKNPDADSALVRPLLEKPKKILWTCRQEFTYRFGTPFNYLYSGKYGHLDEWKKRHGC